MKAKQFYSAGQSIGETTTQVSSASAPRKGRRLKITRKQVAPCTTIGEAASERAEKTP